MSTTLLCCRSPTLFTVDFMYRVTNANNKNLDYVHPVPMLEQWTLGYISVSIPVVVSIGYKSVRSSEHKALWMTIMPRLWVCTRWAISYRTEQYRLKTLCSARLKNRPRLFGYPPDWCHAFWPCMPLLLFSQSYCYTVYDQLFASFASVCDAVHCGTRTRSRCRGLQVQVGTSSSLLQIL